MSTATKDLNLLVYIDKIQRLYPSGVSVSSIVAPTSVNHLRTTSLNGRVLCVVVTSGEQSADALSSNDSLLEAICCKGLQLSKGDYLVERHGTSEFRAEMLASHIQEYAPAVVIVFGGSDSPGTVTSVGSTQVLHAHALDKIASDLSIKKEFWRKLQESVLPIVKEG